MLTYFSSPLPLLPRWLLSYSSSPLPLLPRWLLSYSSSPCHSFLGGCSSSSSSECGSDGGRRTGSSGHFAKLLHQNRRLEVQRRQTHPNLDLDQRSLQPRGRYERVKTIITKMTTIYDVSKSYVCSMLKIF